MYVLTKGTNESIKFISGATPSIVGNNKIKLSIYTSKEKPY